jgi:dimethylamine--corrinoid protein Co-methyltransferase
MSKMQDTIVTRMGDGQRISMPVQEVAQELLEGTQDAAKKAGIPELTAGELEQILEIFAERGRIVSVPHGEEIIVTDDGCAKIFAAGPADGGAALPISRQNSVLAYERGFAPDTVSFGHEDYSFKPAKAVIDLEAQTCYSISLSTTVPCFYGSQPNLGLYFRPDGPHPNPADLLPQGDIDGAREAQEQAAEQLKDDMVYMGKRLAAVGCEGINFDTAASAGDADFYATLVAVSELKEKYPLMSIEVGMSGEFILGMHGQITYEGKRLAGMFPLEQAEAVEAAGGDIFGPAINVNCSKTTPWNLARAVTMVKHVSENSKLPVHPNVGMGVCGVPMCLETPIDCVTRAAKALALIGKADGL